MLKYVLLASAMTIAAPVLAQDKPASTEAAPGRETISEPTTQTATNPAPTESTTAPDTAAQDAMYPTDQAAQTATTPASTPDASSAPAPAQDAAMAQQTTPVDPATAPADTAMATEPAPAPATSKAEQVASVVNTEFPSYDKDSNGDLSEAEFGSWMVALKTASDPATKADSAEVKTWIGQAFASADTDKNKSVSKTELTGFLSQGA